MVQRVRGIMAAVNAAGCAGAIGVGIGFLFASAFEILLAPHLFGRGGNAASVSQLVFGSLFLLVSVV
jgi:hypothetical protein